MKRAPFDVRFVFRNLTRGGGKAWILLFSSSIALMLILMVFSTQPYLVNLLRTQAVERYGSIDMIVTFDANSDRRILNQRKLSTDYAAIGEWSTFFNTTAYAEDRTVQLFGGSDGGMRFLTGSTRFPIDGDEAFITASLAESWNVEIGDRIDIQLKGVAYAYQVVGIETDKGLFADDAVFVDKTALLSRLFAFEGLSNLGNTIYFRLDDVGQIDAWIDVLKSDPEYADFDFIKIIDPITFARIANYTTSVLLSIMLLGIVAVFVVIRSVVPLFHRDFQHQTGVLKPLGAPRGWVEKRWMIQFGVLAILALPIGWALQIVIFELGRSAYGIQSPIAFPVGRLLFGSLAFVLVFGLLSWLEIRRFSALSAMEAARDRRIGKASSSLYVFGVLVLLFLLNAFVFRFPDGVRAAIAFLLGVAIVMESFPAAFVFLGYLFRKGRPSYFGLVSAPWLASSKPMHGAIRVAFITTLVLTSSFSIVRFVDTEADRIVAMVNADYLLANVFDYSDAMKTSLESFEGVDSVNEAILFDFQTMTFRDHTKIFRYHVSMESEDWENAFAFPISDGFETRLNDSQTLYAAVPISIAKSMGIQLGDTIVLEAGSALGALEFEVAGFLETNYDNLILTNLIAHSPSRLTQSINALFLEAAPSQALFHAIASEYGARMYAIVSMATLVESIREPIVGATRFIIVISISFALAFCVVLWNNARMVFHQFKPDYARYWVLGASKRELIGRVAAEFLAMSVLLSAAAAFSVAILLPAANETMLLLGFYKEVPHPFGPSFLASMTGVFLFWLSFGSIAWGIATLQPIQEIKQA
jgi:ABC-type lipoprotein release transport system permease subunit